MELWIGERKITLCNFDYQSHPVLCNFAKNTANVTENFIFKTTPHESNKNTIPFTNDGGLLPVGMKFARRPQYTLTTQMDREIRQKLSMVDRPPRHNVLELLLALRTQKIKTFENHKYIIDEIREYYENSTLHIFSNPKVWLSTVIRLCQQYRKSLNDIQVENHDLLYLRNLNEPYKIWPATGYSVVVYLTKYLEQHKFFLSELRALSDLQCDDLHNMWKLLDARVWKTEGRVAVSLYDRIRAHCDTATNMKVPMEHLQPDMLCDKERELADLAQRKNLHMPYVKFESRIEQIKLVAALETLGLSEEDAKSVQKYLQKESQKLLNSLLVVYLLRAQKIISTMWEQYQDAKKHYPVQKTRRFLDFVNAIVLLMWKRVPSYMMLEKIFVHSNVSMEIHKFMRLMSFEFTTEYTDSHPTSFDIAIDHVLDVANDFCDNCGVDIMHLDMYFCGCGIQFYCCDCAEQGHNLQHKCPYPKERIDKLAKNRVIVSAGVFLTQKLLSNRNTLTVLQFDATDPNWETIIQREGNTQRFSLVETVRPRPEYFLVSMRSVNLVLSLDGTKNAETVPKGKYNVRLVLENGPDRNNTRVTIAQWNVESNEQSWHYDVAKHRNGKPWQLCTGSKILFEMPEFVVLKQLQCTIVYEELRACTAVDGALRDGLGRALGSVSLNGEIRDSTGKPIGKIDSDGRVYNDSGRPMGELHSNGCVYNLSQRFVGSIGSSGEVKNSDERTIGFVKNGFVTNETGGNIGRYLIQETRTDYVGVFFFFFEKM